ncbi:MAG: hypothetical protein JXR96_25540 [Deltaproteobacteria bacterium]|nr:hypothetical protein [Deltaproteobacteria bacterium]
MCPALPSRLWSLLLGCLLCACAGSSSSSDAGQDAAQDGGGDTGARPDYDPAEAFLVTTPEGTALCHGFHQGRTWEQELALVGQIELAAGSLVLPRREGGHPGDWVARVLFGPDRRELIPQGPGQFEAEYEAVQPDDHSRWLYRFQRAYELDGTPHAVEVRIFVRRIDGAWPEEILIDDPPWEIAISGRLTIGPGQDTLTEVQAFGLCALPEDGRKIMQAQTASGDRIELEIRQGPWYDTCLVAGETACYFLVRAELELGAYQASVEDRFRLVYNGSHHNWFDKYLLLLDPPAGDVHAVLVIAPDFSGANGEVVKLDAELAEISRETIAEWTTR